MSNRLWCHGRGDELVRLPPCVGVGVGYKQWPVVFDAGQRMIWSDELAEKSRLLEGDSGDGGVICQVVHFAQ